jgi:hypothetical protein
MFFKSGLQNIASLHGAWLMTQFANKLQRRWMQKQNLDDERSLRINGGSLERWVIDMLTYTGSGLAESWAF